MAALVFAAPVGVDSQCGRRILQHQQQQRHSHHQSSPHCAAVDGRGVAAWLLGGGYVGAFGPAVSAACRGCLSSVSCDAPCARSHCLQRVASSCAPHDVLDGAVLQCRESADLLLFMGGVSEQQLSDECQWCRIANPGHEIDCFSSSFANSSVNRCNAMDQEQMRSREPCSTVTASACDWSGQTPTCASTAAFDVPLSTGCLGCLVTGLAARASHAYTSCATMPQPPPPPCAGGSYRRGGRDSPCAECAAPNATDLAQTRCFRCPTGRGATSDRTGCELCEHEGHQLYSNSGLCRECFLPLVVDEERTKCELPLEPEEPEPEPESGPELEFEPEPKLEPEPEPERIRRPPPPSAPVVEKGETTITAASPSLRASSPERHIRRSPTSYGVHRSRHRHREHSFVVLRN